MSMELNLFKKNIVVGVSVNPEKGLEVAQIDFTSQSILKYGVKPLAYDNLRKEISDLDIFKETLSDLLDSLAIPKGSEIVLNMPTILFNVEDFSASMEPDMVEMQIEENLGQVPVFQNNEASISAVKLPISTIQNNKIAYTALQKVPLIEIALQIKSLGYTVVGIDTSVNSSLNALIYNNRVDIAPDACWLLLIIDNNACRLLPMLGKAYTDSFEEKIAIGEVLGDAENYGTVISAVAPLLKKLPAQRLYILSKTNAINAKTLAEQLVFNGQIIHHNDNIFSDASYLAVDDTIPEQVAKTISLDVIGAAINREFLPYSIVPINLFNSSLGDVYENEQPLKLNIGSRCLVLNLENMIVASIIFAIIAAVIIVATIIPLKAKTTSNGNKLEDIEQKITIIDRYLKENSSISSNAFDEGDETRLGLQNNKNIYTYYTIVGTEIPKKLWLTHLQLGQNTTIEGQADNLESVYAFFRNIKDYNPDSNIKLQKLGLATKSKLVELAEDENFDTDSILTSMNADFYEFKISDAPEVSVKKADKDDSKSGSGANGLPNIEIDE